MVVDGVCSVASEEIRFDDWGIDIVLTASQKGLGVPPGLSLLMASPKAVDVSSSLIEEPVSSEARSSKHARHL